MNADTCNALLDALSVLNDREKYVVGALYINGDSFRTIGKALGVSARTVTRAKQSATAKLFAALGDDCDALLTSATTAEPGIPAPSQPMYIPWNRCARCDGVGATTDGYCERCLPSATAAAMAASG